MRFRGLLVAFALLSAQAPEADDPNVANSSHALAGKPDYIAFVDCKRCSARDGLPACRRITDMMVRFVSVLFSSTFLFDQCDDIAVSAKEAKHLSEVVFQGTIEGFRGSGTDRTVIFRVSRVWKGQIGPTLEMPAIETDGGICTAF